MKKIKKKKKKFGDFKVETFEDESKRMMFLFLLVCLFDRSCKHRWDFGGNENSTVMQANWKE